MKWPILACLAVLLMVGLSCAGVRSWLATPKVPVADVEKLIGLSLPLGTSKQKVEDWLTTRSMAVQEYEHAAGHALIQSWISDSGPRAEWPFGIRDIRVRFFFDENARLIKVMVKEEERF